MMHVQVLMLWDKWNNMLKCLRMSLSVHLPIKINMIAYEIDLYFQTIKLSKTCIIIYLAVFCAVASFIVSDKGGIHIVYAIQST